MKIVFLGDSITEGCFELFQTETGFDTVRDPERGYVSILRRRLQQACPATRRPTGLPGWSGTCWRSVRT